MPQQELDLDSVKDWLRGSHCPPAYRQTMKLLIAEVERLRAAAASSPPPTEPDAVTLLRRIREWDHLDGAADGPYWKQEIDNLLSGLAASPGAREAQPWQPIETAPTDGTNVLLWWPFWCKNRPTIGWFGYKGIQQWIAPEALDGDGDGPTHWMPLPSPPNTSARAAAPGAPMPETKE